MNIGRIRNGAILISAGVILLLNTMDHLSWSVWFRIFSLWPVILVAIGIELLFKKTRLSFLTLISPLLFFAAILGPAFVFDSYLGVMGATSQTYHFSEDLDSTLTEASVSVRLNAGDLVISSGTGKLISTDLDYFERQPVVTYKASEPDSSAEFKLRDRERRRLEWNLHKGRFHGLWGRKNWEIRLTERIPIDLTVYVKTGDADLDLSGLQVRILDLETRTSNARVKISNLVDEVSARIESRTSKVSVSLPEDMALRIENHSNLSSTSFSWFTLEETDDGYETPNFDQAPRRLTLYLEGSLTKLKINRYESSEGI
ncbi:MAG: hypothetical protein JSV10_07860 [Candidatus Zixiibacteriota bacterium]|nr:MAG: hypothetical protein JSV10_07860 [candidate division Zixibacteria bacterium]